MTAHDKQQTPSPSSHVMGPDQKEIVLLNVLAGMGGRTDAGDYPWSWLNWFCNDETERGGTDTFNRCEAKGWINTTHDSDSDHSTTTLTAAGRAIVLASPQPAPAAAECKHAWYDPTGTGSNIFCRHCAEPAPASHYHGAERLEQVGVVTEAGDHIDVSIDEDILWSAGEKLYRFKDGDA